MELKYPKILTGLKFGRLTILSQSNKKEHLKGRTYWVCKCECGEIITTSRDSLTSEKKSSCGCLQRERASESNKKHGLSKDKLYHIWSNMKQRCTNPKHPRYEDYGGRGIKVDDRWLNFSNFKEDIYDSYLIHVEEFGEKNTTIERIDVNKGYSSSNCKWDTVRNQRINQRTHSTIIVNSEKFDTFSDVAKRFNLKERTIKDRYYKGLRDDDLVKPLYQKPLRKTK